MIFATYDIFLFRNFERGACALLSSCASGIYLGHDLEFRRLIRLLC